MTNPNDTICPIANEVPTGYHSFGLTKRELFAAMAMQGMCSNPNFFGPTYQQSPKSAAQFGKDCADALIVELNEEVKP